MRIEKCCALCGKTVGEVKRIILGVHGGICADCVYRCMTILKSDSEATSSPEPPPVTLPSEQPRPFGLCAGEFTVPADFNAPLPDDIMREWE